MKEFEQNAVDKMNDAYQYLKQLDLFYKSHRQSTSPTTTNEQQSVYYNIPDFNAQFPQISPGFPNSFHYYPLIPTTNYVPPTISNVPGSQQPDMPGILPEATEQPVFPDFVVPVTQKPKMPPYIPPRPDPSFGSSDNNPPSNGARGVATEQDDMNQQSEQDDDDGFHGDEDGDHVNKNVDIFYNYYN